MSINDQLSAQDIEVVSQHIGNRQANRAGSKRAVPFDFRRPDRIATAQLRAIHQLHDTFVRNLISSLSSYLRSYIIVNLVSVEQLSYSEFVDCLPSPTCIASMSMKPFDGSAVLELNSSLIFPILEILLGGKGKFQFNSQREITEIEEVLLASLFKLILADLTHSWQSVCQIDFAIDSIETQPRFLKILAPAEAVVAVAIEIRIGDSSGMMNLAIPSIIIKMLRQKLDQQWSLRKNGSAEHEQARMLALIRDAQVDSEVVLTGPTLLLRDLLNLHKGDILGFDFPCSRPLALTLNGERKYRGEMVDAGGRASFRVLEKS